MFGKKAAQQQAIEADLQLGISNAVSWIQRAPLDNRDELSHDLALLYRWASGAQEMTVLMTAGGLAAFVDPAMITNNPTEESAMVAFNLLAAVMKSRKILYAAGRPDLVESLERLAKAHVDVLNSLPAGKAVFGYMQAIGRREIGEYPNPTAPIIPHEGWYLVGEGGAQWRYCDGTKWTDSYAPKE
jgi:hypothetical protein